MQQKQCDLVIFDCDGTLVDTEMVHNTALSNVLTTAGYPEYTPQKCMADFMGTSINGIKSLFEEMYGTHLPDDFIMRNQEEALRLMDAGEIGTDPTTRRVLEYLSKKETTMAVGSNGNRAAVLKSLRAVGYDSFLPESHVFTFQDVERPKPAPDLYLHICKQFNVAPENALVIEDTVTGALAGIHAEIDTIGYVGMNHTPEAQAKKLSDLGCKTVITTMAELLKTIHPQAVAA